MTKNRILLLGNSPVSDRLATWLTSGGDEVVRWSLQTVGIWIGIDAVMDVMTSSENRPAALACVESLIEDNIPIFTSAIHVCATKVSSWIEHKSRVVGFQPWLVDKLDVMEVTRPLQAEEVTKWQGYLEFWRMRGKDVEIVDDSPGLVFPRILATIINEASFALMEGVANKEDIDLAMKQGTNYPYGPLEWADEIGIDEILELLVGLHNHYGDDRYRASPLLRKYVYANWTGREIGHGFYRYQH